MLASLSEANNRSTSFAYDGFDRLVTTTYPFAPSTPSIPEVDMLKIPRRYSHFVYGVIQSGLTCAIATGIANVPFVAQGSFITHWLQSFVVAWIMMLPVVLFAAPAIRNLTDFLTAER